MTPHQQEIARRCLTGAETDGMSFPEVLGALGSAGFEGYSIDFRLGRAAYFLPDGAAVELAIHADHTPAVAGFDAAALRAAILEAQTQAPDYSYKGFCRKAKAAGVAGYMVSLSGRRALYYGRTAETHVELFPEP